MVNSPIRITAGSFNIATTSTSATTNAAVGNANAKKKTGKFRAGASVSGKGKGTGDATIGLKFKHGRETKGKISVSFLFEYRDEVNIAKLPARASAGISILVNGQSTTVTDDRLKILGQIENPAGGGKKLTSKTFNLMAGPGEVFEAVLVSHASATAGDQNNKGKCFSVAEGTLKLVEVRHL
ncbi:MAG: hypothetical protein AB8B94_09480 [Hyphomicrobiales bacterium]